MRILGFNKTAGLLLFFFFGWFSFGFLVGSRGTMSCGAICFGLLWVTCSWMVCVEMVDLCNSESAAERS